MASSVDDDSIGANARAWDFVMPPEGRWTVPLSSELGGQALCLNLAILLHKSPPDSRRPANLLLNEARCNREPFASKLGKIGAPSVQAQRRVRGFAGLLARPTPAFAGSRYDQSVYEPRRLRYS